MKRFIASFVIYNIAIIKVGPKSFFLELVNKADLGKSPIVLLVLLSIILNALQM